MASATCVVRLEGEQIDQDTVSCTGQQLSLIIKVLADSAADCLWFAADVDVVGWPVSKLPATGYPEVLGTTSEVAALVASVPQFLSGVFLALPGSERAPSWSSSFATDDEPFREIRPARLEIRAFDTSYFEVYAAELHFLDPLVHTFGGIAECV